jgi:hypothetical protein
LVGLLSRVVTFPSARDAADDFFGSRRLDRAVFADVLGWRGSRVPITAVVTDLADPQDAGTRRWPGEAERPDVSRRYGRGSDDG